jgi:molybdopterin molybdotransferase/putative molybdopterin biosynthesis protein
MSDRREFRDLASPAELESVIAALDIGGGTEHVPLAAAHGRVLADRVEATLDVPGFDRAAMDGYAVRASDTAGAGEVDPAVLSLAGAVHAGERPDVTVDPETAVEVSTGAVLPPGADAVVMVERTTEREDAVEVRTAVTPGQHVMAAGRDVAAGTRVLGPGTRISPREVGLLSALGVESVPVVPAPTVGIVSTGDELVPPGDPLDHEAGQIYDVNSGAVAAGVAAAGGEPRQYDRVGDDKAAMERVLRDAAEECDLVLSSGSTSASTMDVIYRVLEETGERLLHGVAVKPGKPTIVGRLAGTPYVGLPGYPVSALTIFRTFIAPSLRDAAGRSRSATATIEAEMAVGERYTEGRRRLMPVGLVEAGDGRTVAYPVDKGSGATTTLLDADGIVDCPADVTYLDEGQTVTVDLFSPDSRPPAVLGVGEGDPTLSTVLDDLPGARYLTHGAVAGARSLRRGIADVAVVTDSVETPSAGTVVGGWEREWGLVVGDDVAVDGLADLVGDVAVATLDDQWGLGASYRDALARLATARDESVAAVSDAVGAVETAGLESPARRVADGRADVGVGLQTTAEAVGQAFVPLGTERVDVVVAADRVEKDGVRRLIEALDERGLGAPTDTDP